MRKLTKLGAIHTVEWIGRITHDDEMAHCEEDKLMSHFIESVAAGLYSKKEAAEIAQIVLQTRDFNFARWCA